MTPVLRGTGVCSSKANTKKYGAELQRLMKTSGGKLNPDQIVQAAKPAKSFLHNYFEWDDTVAAVKYRQQQARDLMASIMETMIIDGKQTEQRSFPNVMIKGETWYVSLRTALEEPSYRLQLLNRLISMLDNCTETIKMFRQTEEKK